MFFFLVVSAGSVSSPAVSAEEGGFHVDSTIFFVFARGCDTLWLVSLVVSAPTVSAEGGVPCRFGRIFLRGDGGRCGGLAGGGGEAQGTTL